MSDTLLLNADYKPLSVYPLSTVTWRDAVMGGIFKESMTIVKNHDKWVVRSQHKKYPVPSIVAMKRFKPPVENVKFHRTNIYIRDCFICQYCHEDFLGREKLLTWDHVVPKMMKGGTTWDNLVTCCVTCNKKKKHHVKGWVPLNKPVKPSYLELLPGFRRFAKITIRDAEWMTYFDWPESNIVLRPPGLPSDPGTVDDDGVRVISLTEEDHQRELE